MSESALIFIKALNGSGGANTTQSIEDIANISQPYWVHIDANHPDATECIRKVAPEIDEYTLQGLFTEVARPRALQLEHGFLIILRGINHNEGEEPEDMIAVRLWITATRIVSIRYRRSRAVMQVADSLDQNIGPKTIGDVFAQICSSLLSFIENAINNLYDKLDDLEDCVLDNPNRQLRKDISEARKSAILLRRYITPQKEAINQVRYADDLDWLSAKNLRRIQEAQDSLLRNIEDLDTIRERTQVVKDELTNSLSDKLNRNLYLLSVITAVFLPLGFLTGLFGINIGGMPGVENSSAFTVFCVSLAVVIAVQVTLFKFLKWF